MSGRDTGVIEQVRQANDILDVVSSYVTLKRAGRGYRALCPFHTEKTPSFNVVPEKQVFKCFGCGEGGDVFKFVQLRENVGFREALEILARRAGVSLEPSRQDGVGPTKTDLDRVNRWAARWFQQRLRAPEGAPARQYLTSRGITGESVERFQLGLAPEGWDGLRIAATAAGIPASQLLAAGLAKKRDEGNPYDAFRHRLMFPIYDTIGRVVGFGGRTLGDDQAKYLNTPETILFNKSSCLFGVREARESLSRDGTALIVEGYIDCILAHQFGFSNTVATLGTALTAEHAKLLRRLVDRVILIFDSDEAGRKAAERSIGVFLSERLDVRIAHLPAGQDPADLLISGGPEGFRAVLTSARDALELQWNQLRRRYDDAETGPGRRRAIEAFLLLISQAVDFGACDPIQKGLIVNQLGKLLGLRPEEVNRQLRLVARRSAPAASNGATEPQASLKRSSDPAANAMRELLEVLVNDGSYYVRAAEEFDADLIADRGLRQIATVVRELARDERPFSLAGLLACFESPELSRLVTDLQACGERRGNYEATVDGAVARLRALREDARIAGLHRKVRTTPKDGGIRADAVAGDQALNGLVVLGDAARKTNHFAARKHRAAHVSEGAPFLRP